MTAEQPKSPMGQELMIMRALFEASDSLAYFEREGGPLVIRGDKDIPPHVVGGAVHHMRRTYQEYLTACDGALAGEAQRAVAASELADDIFRNCNAYAADFSIKDLIK